MGEMISTIIGGMISTIIGGYDNDLMGYMIVSPHHVIIFFDHLMTSIIFLFTI